MAAGSLPPESAGHIVFPVEQLSDLLIIQVVSITMFGGEVRLS